jgi:putative nucleotidyltransferase with HDIG domain
MEMNSWPDAFDIRIDPIFQDHIKPFIEKQMEALKEFDQSRIEWARRNLPAGYEVTYLFYDHAYRVSEDMYLTAKHMKLDEHICENMRWAMLPHDIGKSKLPLELWDMMKKPEDDVKRVRRSHTVKGIEIVRKNLDTKHPFVDLMLDIMENHHEQMDGKGYLGKNANELSLPVRLACIIESFDGYSIRRPHFGDRDVTPKGVLKRMREEKGADLYDMELFEHFAAVKLESP